MVDAAQAAEWIPYQIAQAVGGSILFIGIILFIIIFINLAFFAPKGEEEFPVGEAAENAEKAPMVFENWKFWLGITCFNSICLHHSFYRFHSKCTSRIKRI